MGSCYSGLGSKSCPSSQPPIDRNSKQIKSEIKSKSKDSKQLSSSFENISYSEVVAKKQSKESMSSTNKHKIPIPSSKLLSHNKVVPIGSGAKGSQEFAVKKYHNSSQLGRHKSGITCDNYDMSSVSTSVSSQSSLNLSKSSFKSSTSSAISVGLQSSIPKPKSRSPTPPMPPLAPKPLKFEKSVSNGKNRNVSQQQHSDKNRFSVNNSSLMSDRLNGNRIQTNANETIALINRNTISNESNITKAFAGSASSGIKYTTQVSGLPRPQTAHIVSTSSHNHNDNYVNNKINSNTNTNSLLQYSSEKTEPVKCDQSLRQMNKPVYYYGMNKQCPYKRPQNINYNSNRLQFHSSPPNTLNRIQSSVNSQPVLEKRNSLQSNVSDKSRLEYGITNHQTINDNSVNSNKSYNKSQISINKNKVKPEVCESITSRNHNEIDIIPKSIQKVKEVAPVFTRNDKKKSVNVNKSAEISPEHNSISSTSGNEADNRDFLIDDEICDQPELVLSSTIDKNDLVKSLHSELEGLMLKQDSPLSPSTPSSPNVTLSNSTSATITPNTTTFRKPRPLSFVEMPDGSYGLDSPSFRAACQDLIGIKTLLFRLHGILQNAETLNPFDHNYSQNKFYQQLMVSEDDEIKLKNNDLNTLQQENLDLKRQIVLQQQMIEDKDRTIRLLQQQMAKYSNINTAYIPQNIKQEKVNACSQTDRCNNASNINPRAVSDGSNGMLVSFWISKVPAFA